MQSTSQFIWMSNQEHFMQKVSYSAFAFPTPMRVYWGSGASCPLLGSLAIAIHFPQELFCKEVVDVISFMQYQKICHGWECVVPFTTVLILQFFIWYQQAICGIVRTHICFFDHNITHLDLTFPVHLCMYKINPIIDTHIRKTFAHYLSTQTIHTLIIAVFWQVNTEHKVTNVRKLVVYPALIYLVPTYHLII